MFVFPAPFGPRSARISLSCDRKRRPLSALNPTHRSFLRSRIEITGHGSSFRATPSPVLDEGKTRCPARDARRQPHRAGRAAGESVRPPRNRRPRATPAPQPRLCGGGAFQGHFRAPLPRSGLPIPSCLPKNLHPSRRFRRQIGPPGSRPPRLFQAPAGGGLTGRHDCSRTATAARADRLRGRPGAGPHP